MGSAFWKFLLTLIVVTCGLFAVCCSELSADGSPTATPTQVRNSNEIANLSNANANAHLYALDETSPPPSKVVEVSAREGWFDTGIDLVSGQKFMIVASGQWSVGKDSSGPIGTLRECNPCIVPEGSLGELVAKIGTEGFAIGDRMQMRSPRDGRLYLGINDVPDQFRDNRGKVSATITYGSERR